MIMRTEDLQKEQAVLRQVIAASEAIRRKYELIKQGRETATRTLTEVFDPIVGPIKELVSETKESQRKKDEEEEEGKGGRDENAEVGSYERADETNLFQRVRQNLRAKDLDTSLGVRELSRGRLMIGDSPIRLTKDNVIVADSSYPHTPGLLELLVKNKPNEAIVTEADISQYRSIIRQTNADRVRYKANNPIRRHTGLKYTKYVKDRITEGAGLLLPEAMLVSPSSYPSYIYYDNMDELVERLALLSASYQAGNTSHVNEILSIIEELREADVIY